MAFVPLGCQQWNPWRGKAGAEKKKNNFIQSKLKRTQGTQTVLLGQHAPVLEDPTSSPVVFVDQRWHNYQGYFSSITPS